MKIKLIHAHFTVPTGSSGGRESRERIGFTIEMGRYDTVDSVVEQLREKAKSQCGEHYNIYYRQRCELIGEVRELENKLKTLRAEWDATADFLRTQGLNPQAPSMPQFERLLKAAAGDIAVEAEVVEEDDDCYDDDDDDDDVM
jgi:hypothetical protein